MGSQGETNKFSPKNWNSKSHGQLKKMAPQQRANQAEVTQIRNKCIYVWNMVYNRYLAYETPGKEVSDAVAQSQKRIHEELRHRLQIETIPIEAIRNSENHAKLIGQLKAAEARNRIRVTRLRYQGMKAHELKHLIACQPNSVRALRLEALVPPGFDNSNPGDSLDRLQRARVEKILEDETGIATNRKLD